MRKLSLHVLRLLVLLMVPFTAACAIGGTDTHPVALEIMDAGGFTPQFGKAMIDAYVNSHKDTVSKVTYLPRTAAPDLPGKLRAEEESGHVTTTLVLTGYDGLSSSIQNGLVTQLLPNFDNLYGDSIANYVPGAKNYQQFAQGYGLVMATTPSGPIFEYNPAKVAQPPQTIQQLKQWIISHPKQFLYAVPRNSGPGRTLLMGLPYLLNDSNPYDPLHGWDNTWQFLTQIKPYMLPNPTSTTTTIKDLSSGTVSMIASTFGWDLNPKILQQLPGTFKTFELQGTSFVPDAAFMMMPKGLDSTTQGVVLDLMKYLLSPAAQALTYDSGYFYPGPAIQGVDLTAAPPDSQASIGKYLSPDYAGWLANTAVVTPLNPNNLVAAFDKWDSDIGGP